MPTIRGWLKNEHLPCELVARGRVYALAQHYVPEHRQSAACLGPGACILCGAGYPYQSIWAVPVSRPGSDAIWLFRLTPSNIEIAQALTTYGERLTGKVLAIEILSSRPPIRYGVRVSGDELARPAPVEKYLSAIGRKLYALMAERIHAEPNVLDP